MLLGVSWNPFLHSYLKSYCIAGRTGHKSSVLQYFCVFWQHYKLRCLHHT